MKKKIKQKECEWYLYGFCCKDLDAGRAWNCTAPNKKTRIDMCKKGAIIANFSCPYPKLGKD